ncbi:uncharacterized protein [Physcomitrium patens]|nr:uncharacterized protein LOC112273887 [Physcomitrium patens]XP_024358752.1 uncharacterized protein LOC112273923 [Physcomitrium patens]XP_024358818.1 uncharacterized protein LOC112273952 [Physcomitrium patens]XP_024367945.1 uncharacterized protein LOC112278573 [Physcomitrium patens]PNR26108.1 hypothetical protein PHYPA_031125 [Physcomitrium patens]PNR60784.1 hypothetical protein PHYPA_003577 [Physcomitrium patens]PNR60785.1 hypothetical protein PHYPA_003578 [Physcomitrium patens]PNR60787.1 |eukprot:XP_024358687.1 uncharacterized protein LOC112273887 [Physcomitrella patens]
MATINYNSSLDNEKIYIALTGRFVTCKEASLLQGSEIKGLILHCIFHRARWSRSRLGPRTVPDHITAHTGATPPSGPILQFRALSTNAMAHLPTLHPHLAGFAPAVYNVSRSGYLHPKLAQYATYPFHTYSQPQHRSTTSSHYPKTFLNASGTFHVESLNVHIDAVNALAVYTQNVPLYSGSGDTTIKVFQKQEMSCEGRSTSWGRHAAVKSVGAGAFFSVQGPSGSSVEDGKPGTYSIVQDHG